jgi:hypothetical protein
MKSLINGQAWTNPLQGVLVGLTTKLVVSTNGSILSVGGFEEVTQKAKELLSAALGATIDQELNANILQEKEKWMWLQTYGVLVGRTLSVGGSFTKKFDSPRIKDAPLHVVYFLSSVTNINAHPLAKIQYFGSTDPSEIAPEQFDKGDLDRPIEFFRRKPKKLPITRMSGSRWYDADKLLLVHEEKLDDDLSSRFRRHEFSTSQFRITDRAADDVQK